MLFKCLNLINCTAKWLWWLVELIFMKCSSIAQILGELKNKLRICFEKMKVCKSFELRKNLAVNCVSGSYLVFTVFQIQARRTGNRHREPRAKAGKDIEASNCFLRQWKTICCQSKVSNACWFLSEELSDSQSALIV